LTVAAVAARPHPRAVLRLAKGAVGSLSLPLEMKIPEVCDLENHKRDNGDD
jgi:hypothetical protein